MKVQVIATGEDTCSTGREIDWGFASDYLVADLRVEADWIVPFRPHALLKFNLDKAVEHISLQQIVRFNPAPRLENIRTEWTKIPEHVPDVTWQPDRTICAAKH